MATLRRMAEEGALALAPAGAARPADAWAAPVAVNVDLSTYDHPAADVPNAASVCLACAPIETTYRIPAVVLPSTKISDGSVDVVGVMLIVYVAAEVTATVP